MKKFYALFLIALMGISSVWAQTYDGGTWYSLLQNQEFNQGSIGTLTKEFDVFPPTASTMTFQWKNKKFWFDGTYGSVDLNFYESTDGSSYGEVQQVVNCGVGTDKTSYQNDSYTILNPTQLQKFKFTLGTSYGAWVSYLKLPLAKHILLSGGDYGKSSVTKTFTKETRIGESSNIRADFRSFLTAGNISISLTEGDADVFRLGSADNTSGVLTNSTAGNTYAVGANACASANGTAAACANGKLGKIDNYSFQIYFCPKAVGEATGKITITDGTSTATITVKATGIKAETLEVGMPLSFCEGGSVEFHGKTYEAAGTDVVEAEGATRDTIYNVTVSVLQPSFGTAEMTMTYGEEKSWNGIALKDSTVGTHTVIYETTNVAGCDSTVTLTLTVNKIETLNVPVDLAFCAGGSETYRDVEYTEAGVYEVPAEGTTRDTLYIVNVTLLQPSFGTDTKTMIVGDDETWNGIALKDSTVGTHSVVAVLENAVGCDSTVTLTLTVNKIETLNVPVNLAFCAGGSETYRDVEYTEAGTYEVPVEGATRDTLFVINVTVLQPSFGTDTKTMIVGDDETWNGIALKDSTVGTHIVLYETTNVAGCDSTVTLTLTIQERPTTYGEYEAKFCEGDSVEFAGKWYFEATQENVTLEEKNIFGGDSIVMLTVTMLPVYAIEERDTVLQNSIYEWQGETLTTSELGTFEYTKEYTTVEGCDSTVTLYLTVEAKPIEPEDPTALELVEAAQKAVKEFRNGVLHIRREGKEFTLDGRLVK